MDFRGPYKNILLYHGMGSGKTITAINVYNMLHIIHLTGICLYYVQHHYIQHGMMNY